MRFVWRATTIALGLAFGATAQPPGPSIALPKEVAEYRQWPHLLKEQKAVPVELWLRCMAPSEEDWREAARTHGPHNRRFIQVYANALALPAARDSKRAFPAGAILVKEKIAESGEKSPAGVAVMIKRDTARFAASGGWEFLYFPSESKKGVHEGCAGCHGAAPGRQVFGAYTPWEQ